MATIALSYLIVGGIVAAAISAVIPGISSMVQSIIGIVLYIIAIWIASRHIAKKSIISPSSLLRTIVGMELFFIVIGGILFAASGSAALVYNLLINMFVVGVSLFFFLKRAA